MTSPSGKSNSTLALRIREEHVSDHQRKLPETAMGSTRPTGPNHRNVTGIQNSRSALRLQSHIPLPRYRPSENGLKLSPESTFPTKSRSTTTRGNAADSHSRPPNLPQRTAQRKQIPGKARGNGSSRPRFQGAPRLFPRLFRAF